MWYYNCGHMRLYIYQNPLKLTAQKANFNVCNWKKSFRKWGESPVGGGMWRKQLAVLKWMKRPHWREWEARVRTWATLGVGGVQGTAAQGTAYTLHWAQRGASSAVMTPLKPHHLVTPPSSDLNFGSENFWRQSPTFSTITCWIICLNTKGFFFIFSLKCNSIIICPVGHLRSCYLVLECSISTCSCKLLGF